MKLLRLLLEWSLGLTMMLFTGPAVPAQSLYPSQDEYGIIPSRMQVSMEVLVNGRPVPTIYHAGKTYLPVPSWGTEYQIRIWNHGSKRIAAIVSVDGLSVINGQRASESHPGYLVSPHSSIVIDGWRKSMQEVAAFRFEPREESYAARMGHPENIGVIGLIAIEEKTRFVPLPRPLLENKSAARVGDSFAPSPKQGESAVGGTGTGYGRDIYSPTYEVPFVRSNHRQTVTIFYDTRQALHDAGVPVDGYYPVPFPADPRFVPPPPR
jgi:hypothetical protein